MSDSTKIRVELSFTANLGNFQSVKVNVGIEDWKRDTDQSVDAAFERVYNYVESKLVEKLEQTKKELDEFA